MFKVNNKIIDVVFVFLLLTFNMFHTFSSVSTFEFEQVNVSKVRLWLM